MPKKLDKKFDDCSDRVKLLIRKRKAKRGRPKNKVGAPTKYDPVFADIVPELFVNGASVQEVATELGVHIDTLYDWGHRHREFAEAMAKGKQLSEAWWLRQGRKRLGAKELNAKLYQLHMINRFTWQTRGERELSAGGSSEPVEVCFALITPERAKEIRENIRNGSKEETTSG